MLCAAAVGGNTFRQWCSSIHTEHAWTTTMKGLQKRVYCWIFSQSYAIFCICLVHRMQVVNNGSISVPLRFLFPVSLARKVKVFFTPMGSAGESFTRPLDCQWSEEIWYHNKQTQWSCWWNWPIRNSLFNTKKQPKFILKRVSWKNILLFSCILSYTGL